MKYVAKITTVSKIVTIMEFCCLTSCLVWLADNISLNNKKIMIADYNKKVDKGLIRDIVVERIGETFRNINFEIHFPKS
jgi:hypothetical protein